MIYKIMMNMKINVKQIKKLIPNKKKAKIFNKFNQNLSNNYN